MQTSDGNGKLAQLEFLAQVHALTHAIRSAIAAMEKNDLAEFQNHLATQETICNRLPGSAESLLTKGVAKTAEAEDLKLEQEIRYACASLAKLNRTYAVLLKRSQKSIELITAIYGGMESGYQPGSAAGRGRTWSCEV